MVEFTLLSRSFGWILGSDREDEKRGIFFSFFFFST